MNKMTKAERREQRERVEESMEHMSTTLIRISICVAAKNDAEMRTALDVYDRAIANTKGIKYRVDNNMYFGGLEKRRERAERRRGE